MLLQTEFENSNRIPQKFESLEFINNGKRKRYLATIYDIMMKPVHDVNLTKLSKLPENKVKSKTEYTNTQQDLPD